METALAQIRSMLPSIFGEPEELLIPEPPQPDLDNPDAPAPIVAHRLDFVKLGLPEYEHKFAMVIDNLFTPEDCARYVAKYVDATYRNSSRILHEDHDLAKEMFQKLKPYLNEIEHMEKSPFHRTSPKMKEAPPARLIGLNERLRFLKYGPGQFFRSHCDSTYRTPDRKQISYYTLQLYLNGSAEELQGGTTRFWKSGRVDGPDKRTARPGERLRKFVDVPPRVGRALIFEQQGIEHSGEDVKKGIKLTVRSDLMYEACLKEEPDAEVPA